MRSCEVGCVVVAGSVCDGRGEKEERDGGEGRERERRKVEREEGEGEIMHRGEMTQKVVLLQALVWW